jgi:hypothetical protein
MIGEWIRVVGISFELAEFNEFSTEATVEIESELGSR